MKKFLQAIVLMMFLTVASGPAMALGLGPIVVKSRAGQPLLAEIPIISNDPAELQGLQARLASPDTFQRVGLQIPTGLVAQLHFEPAIDEQGRPVIRVTSPVPVDRAALDFLIEVEWNGGRLVREYSALVDSPRTVAAPIPPPVQAPVAAAPNVIAAPLPPAPPPIPAEPTPITASSDPTPSPPPIPQPMPQAMPAQTAAATAVALSPVQRGQTLSQIARGMTGEGVTLEAAMLALLRSNPEAFIDNNIHRLRAGAILRMPAALYANDADARRAAARVEEQMARWRDARGAAAVSADTPALTTGAQATRARREQGPTRLAEARLRIMPAAAGAGDAGRAGDRGGSGHGNGDDDMQQLQEARETIASRDAELAELRSRVAELEALKTSQDQLLSMKDTQLAAAQQRLAQQQSAARAAPPTAPESPMLSTLYWLVPLVLALAVVGGWFWWRGRQALPWTRPTAKSPDTASTGTAATRTPISAAFAPGTSTSDLLRGREPGAAMPAPNPEAAPAPDRLEDARLALLAGHTERARELLQQAIQHGGPMEREAALRRLRDLG